MSFVLEIKKSGWRHRVSSQQWSVTSTHYSHMHEINRLQLPGPVLSFSSTEPVSYHHRPRGISSRDSEGATEGKPRQVGKGKEKLVEGAEGE